jgi:hypothetical protein
MRSTALSALLLSSLLAAGCGQDSPTAIDGLDFGVEQARSAAPKLVPFKATYEAQAGFTPVAPEVCPTGLADVVHGEGQATHLGRITVETFACIDLTTLQATNGRFTFASADGSHVTGSYQLQGTPQSETLLLLEGSFAITDGTRRFAGASGGGQVTGTIDFATGALVLSCDGLISSVGSLR